jgi:MFS family permease
MRNLVTAYRRVLRDPHLRRLLAGEFVSGVGDWLYLVAILVMLYDRTRDPVLLGVVAAARVLPYIVLSVPAGIVADRFDRRAVLIVTDLARGALMLVLAGLTAVDGDIALVVGVAIAATCFSSFFGPAIGAYLPTLVKDESDLGPANTAYATLNEITYILGPALAAVVISLFDLSLAFLLNALSFAVVAAVLWTLPSSRPSSTGAAGSARDADGSDREHDDEAASDATSERAVRRSWRDVVRPLAGLSIVDAGSSFAFGGLGVLSVVIAYELLDAGEAGTGALNAAMGIGGLVGTFVTGALVLRRRLGPPLLLGAAVLAVGIVVLGASGSLGLSMLAIAAASGGALLIEVICTTLLQRIAPDEVRGRAFGVMQTVDVIAFAGGSLAIPALTAWVGLAPVLVACAIAVIGATLVAVVLLGEWLTAAPAADPARARLAKVPMLAGLSPARLERAERRAVPILMHAGDVVVRQDDEADRFYVIVDGTVDVTQTSGADPAPRHLRSMGEGEAFGEIGLLTGVPRTATVTAASDGQLLALDKDDFLELVAEAGAGAFPLADPYLGRVSAGGLEAMLEGSR